MRFMTWHLAIAAWLMLSAFALGYSEGGTALTVLLGMLIGTVGFAAAGLPTFRLLNAPLAIALGLVGLFSVDSSFLARGNDLLFAAVVFALSVVPGRAWGGSTPEPAP